MIVVDASVVLTALLDDGPAGIGLRRRLALSRPVAPSVLDLEVVSALRGRRRGRLVRPRRADAAVSALGKLAIRRVAHVRLLPRIWELCDNLTAYDAAYVALAEALDAPLVTGDARLARAPGIRCAVEVVTDSGPAS